ncbi:MAG: NACHT domain-containing protein [Methylococcales bacterium]
MATLSQLVDIKSQLAEDLLRYYASLITNLDAMPWYRDDLPISLREVQIRRRVFKEDTRIDSERGTNRFEWGVNDTRTIPIEIDPVTAPLYEEPTGAKSAIEVDWADEQQRVTRAVVFGGPGSGKSSLTKTLAIDLASRSHEALDRRSQAVDQLVVPIHFTCTEFASDNLPDDLAEAVLELLSANEHHYCVTPRFKEWLKPRLRTGQVWLILDSLDEVPHDALPRLKRRLRAMDTQAWSCRCVITCRTANYKREDISWSEFTKYELCPFNREEIQSFVERWFAADEARKDSLRNALDRNFTLRHACRIPILLTLTCLAHEEHAITKNTRRVDLYQTVLRGLIRRAWKQNSLPRGEEDHIYRIVRLLERIALRLFEKAPTSKQFARNEIIEQIKSVRNCPLPWILEKRFKVLGVPFSKEELRLVPEMLIQQITDCGIFVESGFDDKGEKRLSFLHRTFLEYLTARALASNGCENIDEFVDKRAWLHPWREVIVFLHGLLSNPIPLINDLAEEGKDDMHRPRLAIAIRGIAEMSMDTRKKLSRSLKHRISNDIESLWATYRTSSIWPLMPHIWHCLPVWCELDDGITGSNGKLPRLLVNALDNNDPVIRSNGAMALGEIGHTTNDPIIVEALLNMVLRTDRNGFAKIIGAKALGRLIPAAITPMGLERLLAVALGVSVTNNERDIANLALKGLSKIVVTTPEALNKLIDAIQSDDSYVKMLAADTLATLGPNAAIPAVLEYLARALEDRDAHVRLQVAEALAKIGPRAATPVVLEFLAIALRDQNAGIRSRVAEVLCNLGPAAVTVKVINALITAIDDPECKVKVKAIKALGNLGPGTASFSEVISSLKKAIGDADWQVRTEAYHALRNIEPTMEIPAVLGNLRTDLRDRSFDWTLKKADLVGISPTLEGLLEGLDE